MSLQSKLVFDRFFLYALVQCLTLDIFYAWQKLLLYIQKLLVNSTDLGSILIHCTSYMSNPAHVFSS